MGVSLPAAGLPGDVYGQEDEVAYLRSAAIHFDYTPGEVAMLAEDGVSADELPVALLIARSSGVSASAVLALRRSGRAWADLLVRYGLHAGRLYIPLESPPAEGAGADAYEAFASREPRSWRVIRLPDEAVVYLVNLDFLSHHLEVPPDQVAQVLTREGSSVQAHHHLLRARAP